MSQRLPPPVDSIQEGKVVRIEDYGAFVQLSRAGGFRGLVHISQLSSHRVDHVRDVVELEDHVWVKVLEVEQSDGHVPTKYKIRLSMKGVPQDGTAAAVHLAEQQAHKASHSLQQNLNSTIGIAIARDPMENASGSRSRIVLKKDGQHQPQLINGYALLEDEEEEASFGNAIPSEANPTTVTVKPLGRGRGATIPAWMAAQQKGAGGPTGLPKEGEDENKASSDAGGRHRHKKKKHKKEHRREHEQRDKKRSTRRESDRHKRRYGSDSSNEERHRRRKKRSRDEDRKRRHSRRRSPSHSSSEYSRDSDMTDRRGKRSSRASVDEKSLFGEKKRESSNAVEFQSVEEAKRLIQEIEARRRHKEE